MAFYIYPPGGNISLQNLESFAVTRLKFLSQIYDVSGEKQKMYDIVMDTENVQNSECLIRGTVKDKISHYFLRLACSEDRDMQSFFIRTETILFDYRVSCMSLSELAQFLKFFDSSMSRKLPRLKLESTPRNISLYNVEDILRLLSRIPGKRCWKKVVELYLQGESSIYFNLPFQVVLPIVASRRVRLERGEALIPYCKLREVLTIMFQMILKQSLMKGRHLYISAIEDPRIKQLFLKLKVIFRQKYRNQSMSKALYSSLSHDQIDRVMSLFPPCMSSLMSTLRSRHRLDHHSRVRLTLFLKEAGLPLDEALMFWRKEYSKSADKCSCTHSWNENERRYTYSIRHLYGLEGSKVNYSSHCCKTLQDLTPGPTECGGCPFKHFDQRNLRQFFKRNNVPDKFMMESVTRGNYTEACSLFMRERLKILLGEKGLTYPLLLSNTEHHEQDLDKLRTRVAVGSTGYHGNHEGFAAVNFPSVVSQSYVSVENKISLLVSGQHFSWKPVDFYQSFKLLQEGLTESSK